MKNKTKIFAKVCFVFFAIFSFVFANFAPVFAENYSSENLENLPTSEISGVNFAKNLSENLPENLSSESSENPETSTENDPKNPPENSENPDENSEQNSEQNSEISPIQFSRISTINGGEFVQIANFSDTDFHFDTLEIKLFNSNNNLIFADDYFELPAGNFAKNSFILLGEKVSDFAKNLPDETLTEKAGAAQIFADGELQDEICWGNSGVCAGENSENLLQIPDEKTIENSQIENDSETNSPSGNSRFLFANSPLILESGGFLADVLPEENPENPDEKTNACDDIKLNEIGANLDAQFVEIANFSGHDADISGCRIMTNRSEKNYFAFAKNTILPSGNFAKIAISDTNLTLTKTTSGTVYLLSSDGITETDSASYANLTNETSFAKFADGWKQTYDFTPGAENIFQEFPACADGYFRNSETGRCNKIAELAAPKICDAGYFLNAETNRCNKNSVAETLAACAEGSVRNPETGRCKQLETSTEPAPCETGWERSPETNRCRKIASSASANYPVKTAENSSGNSNWILAAGAILLGMFAIILWQFREEIGKFFAKIRVKILAKKYYNEMSEKLRKNE